MQLEKQYLTKSNLDRTNININKFKNQNNYELEVMKQNLKEKKCKNCETESFRKFENKQNICNLVNKVLKSKSNYI